MLLLIATCLFSNNAFAYDAQIDGIYYDLREDSAIVTYRNWGVESYSGNIVIPDYVIYLEKTYSVRAIGATAFSGCSGLTSVAIPNSVTSIGDYAFRGCSALTSVVIPNSVTSLGYGTFDGCEGLIKVIINSNTVLNKHQMRDIFGYQVKTYVIGEDVTSIGNYVFDGCSGLTSVNIPNSVTSIGYYAFYGCSGLTSVTIPNSVTSIGSGTFYGCSGLTSVTIPNSVTSIGWAAFKGCSSLTSVTIPNSLTSIDDEAFSDCTELASIIFEEGSKLVELGGHVFRNTYWENNLPDGLIYLGKILYKYNCKGMTTPENQIVIKEGTITIADNAFDDCSTLNSLIIPESVLYIGDCAFEECNIRNVLIKCIIPPGPDVVKEQVFSDQTYYHTILYVPAGCWDAYAYHNQWYRFINIRETATTEEEVAMQQAYTLMDTETFTYSVYDPVNNCIGTIKSVSAIDENNPNHSWQVITDGSKQYLYNLGAKKFATNGADGRLVLTAEPTPIDMKDGDNGIVLGSQAARQWALVGNDRLSVEQDIITGIDEIADTQQGESTSYDLQGRRIDKAQKGINIICNADGTTKKVLMR